MKRASIPRLNFSTRGRARVALITIVGTLGCMAIALLAVSYTTQFMAPSAKALTWASAILIPIFLSAPIFYWFASKLRELAIAHHELAIIASKDSLTTCLNRGAFVTLVDAYLRQVNSSPSLAGALLMIDADNFKSINDRFGHAIGDEALKAIASTIKAALRPDDLLGRVGGEEFAIFLPKVDEPTAVSIAERVRQQVGSIDLAAGGIPVPISISVGGAGFHGRVLFDDLFRAADARLYAAKKAGRNRVVFAGWATDWAAA
jgi:diguanylate cyclase